MSQEKTSPRAIPLGATGPKVFPIALGCMGMSGMYGASADDEGVRTIHAAVERGVTLIDTGDFYGHGHNELLVRRALEGLGARRDELQISVKFGGMRSPDGAFIGIDCRPAAVKNFAAYSLKRLGVDVIDVYRPARLDPHVPIEDTVGAIADLIQRGYVRHMGLSEVGVETIRRAHAVHPVVDLQIEYSLASRGPEEKIFPVLEELGISATLYGVLSRGLLSGRKPSGPGDFRAHLPRFTGENGAHNEAIVERLRAFAARSNRTTAQIAVAWALAKQPKLVPLVGARTREQLDDVLGALAKPLSADELRALEDIVPPGSIRGDRYQAGQMAHLDSER
ncbi:aldo/keto reductase [Pendulispora albinea]|uniref:Aldo/keto reductase n=1 Tax=Pendulispora albinea TaxID=2741071 RepID=A0ABZ2M611_9BACT